MIVTAWNNGKHHQSGAGYGLKVSSADRDHYFNRKWKKVLLKLEGEKGTISVNIDKQSFWDFQCRELICKWIGQWLIKNKKTPWLKDNPPKMEMEHITNNIFKVTFI